MNNKTSSAPAVGLLLCLGLSHSFCHADPGMIEELLVSGQRVESTEETDEALRARLALVPGGTNLVELSQQLRLTTLSDVFNYQPGVIVQEFFGGWDQPRLNVRGSGLQSNPVSRGLLLRQDYLPMNDADGAFLVGLLEPRNSRVMTVHRGANSRVPGAVTLGGDLNTISRTGSEHPGNVRTEWGSYGRETYDLNYGGKSDKADYHISMGYNHFDGYRHHSKSQRWGLRGNAGIAIGDRWSNRSYLSYVDNRFEMPFVLPEDRAKEEPRSVIGDGNEPIDQLFNIYRRDPRRAYDTLRVANRTHYQGDGQQQTIGAYWQKTNDTFVDPLKHTVTHTNTVGLQWLWSADRFAAGYYTFGVDWNYSDMPRQFYINNPGNGSRGAEFGDLDLKANNLALSLAADYPIGDDWLINAQLQWIRSIRNSKDKFDGERLDQDWQFWLPKLGVIYQPQSSWRLFANLSASKEPPTFWEIVQASVPPVVLNPAMATVSLNEFELQDAVTVEVGSSGSVHEALGWDLTFYHSEIRNEILSTASDFGVIAESSNYDEKTRHQGVELGLHGKLPLGAQAISYRAAWNVSNFRFVDGEFDGNRIAGVPRQVVTARIAWHVSDFTLSGSVLAQPTSNYVDHANTLEQESFEVYGLQLNYQPAEHFRVYLAAENIADTAYNSAYVVRAESSPDMPTFLPGTGRSFNVGMVFGWE